MTDAQPDIEVLAQAGLKAVQSQRKLLQSKGISAEVLRPPGEDPNR